MGLLVPWTARTHERSGAILPIHGTGGYNFFLGNGFVRHFREAPLSYEALKQCAETDVESVYAARGRRPADGVDRDRLLLRAALEQLLAEPQLVVLKPIVQSVTFWYLAASPLKSAITGLVQIPLAVLAVAGLFRARANDSPARYLAMVAAGIFGASIFVFAFARLSATVVPYCIGLAVYEISHWRIPLISRRD